MFKSFSPNRGRFYFCLYLVAAAVIFGRRAAATGCCGSPGHRKMWRSARRASGRSTYLVFYAYYLFCVGVFALFWFVYCPHRWQYWSILGTSLIIFVTGFWWKSGWRSTPGMRRSTT